MARAVSAGLTKLLPSPPKIIFTSTMASSVPITGIHTGTLTGRL